MWKPSRFQRVYFMWLVYIRGHQMLDEMKSESDYTRIKDRVLRSAKRGGMKIDMKSEAAMATDIMKWSVDDARPSLPRSKNDVA